ncbi:sporulation transcription factor Spo0A [Wukongibacter sp. M2B1]|uniref:sporulation transcription factor Spo0A n=1 Tax=Wukongibacter sp. M2B1 TaxID=3088895 RepID=UPI003D7B8ACF
MKKLKILIVDDNKNACEILLELINSRDDMSVVGIANDGEEGFKLLLETKPDVVLLDIIMPHLDGLGFLRKIKGIKNLKIIVISASRQENIIREALTLGADCYLIKPINFNEITKKIRKLANCNISIIDSKTDIKPSVDMNFLVELNSLFTDMRVPTYLKGYQFLQEAIIMIVENQILDFEIKDIYSYISKQSGYSKNIIRRYIQHVIESTWSRGNKELLIKYFASKPDNDEFITTISKKFIKQKD